MAKRNPATVVLSDGRSFNIDPSNPKPSDLVALERKYDISSDDVGTRREYGLFVMFRMCRRADPSLADDFEAFVDLVDDVVNEKAPAPDPTPERVSTA